MTVDDLFEDGYPDDWVATSRRGGRRSARAARRRLGALVSSTELPVADAVHAAAAQTITPRRGTDAAAASGDIDGVYGDAVDGVYTEAQSVYVERPARRADLEPS